MTQGSACSVFLPVAAALSIGYVLGRFHAVGDSSGNQLQEPRRLSGCSPIGALDKLLGITDAEAEADIRAQIPAVVEPLRRRSKSKTILQDAFVRLHNMLFDRGLLPITQWGKGRGLDRTSNQTPPFLLRAATPSPARKGMKYHVGPSVLSRLAFNVFLEQQTPRVRPGSLCLGWDDIEYVDAIPGCDRRLWTYQYATGPRVRIDWRNRILEGDLAEVADMERLGRLGSAFGLIMCQQVFEHVSRPWAAVRALHNLLSPGGLLFWLAPFAEQYHLVPGDFFRYSLEGARSLLREGRLEILSLQKIGDTAIASGFLLGFGAGDIPPRRLASSILQNISDRTSRRTLSADQEALYIGVAAVARKPDQ